VEVYIPDVNKTLNTTISLISQSIDPTTRGFIAEARIPTDPVLKPNQSAVIKIMDYAAPNAVVIPVNVVQADESGKYVYVVETAGNKQVAKKKSIVIGEVYGEWVEVKSGLNAGEQLITEAYQNLYEGQLVGTGTK
jgi:multidrug efflux pump subunit AcrA (membrane-fusion protein)